MRLPRLPLIALSPLVSVLAFFFLFFPLSFAFSLPHDLTSFGCRLVAPFASFLSDLSLSFIVALRTAWSFVRDREVFVLSLKVIYIPFFQFFLCNPFPDDKAPFRATLITDAICRTFSLLNLQRSIERYEQHVGIRCGSCRPLGLC